MRPEGAVATNHLVAAVRAANADNLLDASTCLVTIASLLVTSEADRIALALYLLGVIDELAPGMRAARWQ